MKKKILCIIAALLCGIGMGSLFFPRSMPINSFGESAMISVFFSEEPDQIVPPPYTADVRMVYIYSENVEYNKESKAHSRVYTMDIDLEESLRDLLSRYKIRKVTNQEKKWGAEVYEYHISFRSPNGNELKVQSGTADYATRVQYKNNEYVLLKDREFQEEIDNAIQTFLSRSHL